MEHTLYIAWQSADSREWYTVGVLTHSEGTGYVFRYVRGAISASEDGFTGISTFPDFDRSYRSHSLFSFFANRILSSSRPEYKELISQVGLQPVGDKDSPDYVFDFLRRTRGWRATDSFEMFAPVGEIDDGYRWDFFTRGVRHGDDAIKQQWIDAAPEPPLRPSLDCHNKYDPTAVIILDRRHRSLGFVPGNYSSIIYKIVDHAEHIDFEILRHNREEHLHQKRFLLELTATMPADFQLSQPPELEPLLEPGETVA